MAMWKAAPQYTFTKTDGASAALGDGETPRSASSHSRLDCCCVIGGELPIACFVRINDKRYPTTAGPNKPIAKEAAAEAVLEEQYVAGSSICTGGLLMRCLSLSLCSVYLATGLS
jgi:hypothetical protein